MGIGDWGLGIGDWAQSPIPNPHNAYNQINIFHINLVVININIKLLIIYDI